MAQATNRAGTPRAGRAVGRAFRSWRKRSNRHATFARLMREAEDAEGMAKITLLMRAQEVLATTDGGPRG